jgi:hypothetical protein
MAEKKTSTKTDALRAAREQAASQREVAVEKRKRCKHPPARRFSSPTTGAALCADCGGEVS